MATPDRLPPLNGENFPATKGPNPIGLHIFAYAAIFLGLNKSLYEIAQLSRGNTDWFFSMAILAQGVIFMVWGIGSFMKKRGFYLLGLAVIVAMSINLLVNTIGMFIRLGAPQMSIGLVWFIPIIMALYDYFASSGKKYVLLKRFGVIDETKKFRFSNLFTPFNVIIIFILCVAVLIERIVLR